ncbi:hypothetical protein ASPNIDRAFT_43851 [Aspergillus niger ATCC 1015]|uniref:Uncharacterized protein n=1 Tax=Aspergillus niger (strain ATCC 1015 / CBS 113.46 / FGSC A1144 / LSHB Ac4 / NCTC 3858a / NRRL 328 / USDA 3528.7) TaxID=380704 RepID=G3XUA7_ASPNA|nr:hypothetical protein ASPNIDRAFT_43851 [Aspergillus niger ATCC 1015]SPB46541.1 unnamed protein product [Aspergillus niger]
MSSHPNESYTPAPYRTGGANDYNSLGSLYDLYTVSYGIGQPENGLLSQAHFPVYRQTQADTHLGYHTLPRFSQPPREQPPHDEIRYGFPTGPGNYGIATTVVQQAGVAPQDLYNQAGSIQGNGPANNPSILGAVTPLVRQANIAVEEYAVLPSPGANSAKLVANNQTGKPISGAAGQIVNPDQPLIDGRT